MAQACSRARCDQALAAAAPEPAIRAAHAIDDRADRLEVGRFLVGVVGNLDAEGVLDVEHDHRQIEGLDLEIGQRRVEPDVVPGLFHVLLQDVDDLGRYIVHFALPPCPDAGMSGPLLLTRSARSGPARKAKSSRHIYANARLV